MATLTGGIKDCYVDDTVIEFVTVQPNLSHYDHIRFMCDAHSVLTPRQQLILPYRMNQYNNHDIAQILNISDFIVSREMKKILKALKPLQIKHFYPEIYDDKKAC